MDKEQRRLELLVLRAAIEAEDLTPDLPSQLRQAVEELVALDGGFDHSLAGIDQELSELAEMVWVKRTWADVRDGDTVRLPHAPDSPAKVVRAEVRNWHVNPRSSEYQPVAQEWSEARILFEGRDSALTFKIDDPIEIHLSTYEIAAIEALGWENRIR